MHNKTAYNFACFIRDLVCGALAAFLADIIFAQLGKPISPVCFVVLFVVISGLLAFLNIKFCKFAIFKKIFAAAAIIFCIFSAACYGFFYTNSKYTDVDTGKTELFGNKRIMVIVPHQDDDLNVAGGLMEEYLKYGSDVYVVFVTNGDYTGISTRRLQEAVDVMDYIGVPEENIVFLGYGDGWNGAHIYNSPADERKASIAGKMETYGLEEHPAYNDNAPYTRENLVQDLKSCIIELAPDVIICSDYDSHNDHQAVSMFFEEAMGMILKEEHDYTPIVLKAFAYSTAYYATDDYYADNILSTKSVYDSSEMQECNIYVWNDRIRLPVNAGTLSHSLLNADGYIAAKKYSSQDAKLHAVNVINGDKVFWERRTDSLCYIADITASSGDSARLNDFKLVDNNDVYGTGTFTDGTWHPDENDDVKQINIIFPEEVSVTTIRLYDNPSEEDNILNVHISFDTGTEIDTSALIANGSATELIVPEQRVKSATLTITDSEGAAYGLTEVEMFEEQDSADNILRFVKLEDCSENFVYNYIVPISGKAEFKLFATNLSSNIEDYVIMCSDPESVSIENGGVIDVNCQHGKHIELSVTSAVDSSYSDTILISNPSIFYRYGMNIEGTIHSIIRHSYKETASYK